MHHQPVERHLTGTRPALGTVVVDPPRTGLSEAATRGLVAWTPARVVYVSCDPATLARDVRRFLDAGYRLGDVRGFDLFPRTGHVEAVVTLEHAEPRALRRRRRRRRAASARRPRRTPRTAAGTRRCARSSRGATARPGRSATPGRSMASMTPSGAVATTSQPVAATCRPPGDGGCSPGSVSPSSSSSFISAAKRDVGVDPHLVGERVARAR